MDAATLAAARDVGGWVFATVAIATGAGVVIRWLMRLVDRQTRANEKLADSVDALTREIQLMRRR